MTDPHVSRPSKAQQWVLFALAVLGFILLIIAAVGLMLPHWLQGSGARQASQALGREVVIGHVDFMPWRLKTCESAVRRAWPGRS